MQKSSSGGSCKKVLHVHILNHKVHAAEHYADDLEADLEEIMVADFNTEVEDDSPREVSKELVALHNDLITGQTASIHRLQASAPAAVAASVGQPVSIPLVLLLALNKPFH